jgi:hypothetical protein
VKDVVGKESPGCLRINLRGFLLCFLAINLAIGAFAFRATKRKAAVESFEAIGGSVTFDHESEKLANSNFAFQPRDESLLRRHLHNSAVQQVVVVSFVNANRDVVDNDLRHLRHLREVRCLCLMRIEPFGIPKCRITDAGMDYLLSLNQVEVLQIGGAPLTDRAAEKLSRLKSLRTLWLEDAKLTDAGLKELAELPNLTELCVYRTQVTEDGVVSFKKRLPHCKVYWDGE